MGIGLGSQTRIWIGDQIGDRTGGGLDYGSDWGSDEVAGKISQVSLRFADMSFDVDIVHPTCPSLGKVKFGLDKVTSWSITITAEAITTS